MQTEAQRALMNVLSGAWGTIGPRSLSAARRIAKRVSGRYGLLVHSASAAMEVQLRSLKIGYGDEVIAASYGDPINAMAVACVGATPVFVDIDPETATLSPVTVKNALTGKTRAVIADTPGGNPCDAKALAKICADHGIKLVVNLGDGYNTALHGKPMARYAWGTVLDLSDGCALPAGEGGALVQMDGSAYIDSYACHNCGREPGEGDALALNPSIGGNFRISEWQAAMAELGMDQLNAALDRRGDRARTVLKNLAVEWLAPIPVIAGGVSSYHSLMFRVVTENRHGITVENAAAEIRGMGYGVCRPWKAMHRQPFFASAPFCKMTGFSAGYGDDGLTNSINAEETCLWIKL